MLINNSKYLEKKISTNIAYIGSFFEVRKDRVKLSDNTETSREYIIHPGAAAIVAKTANNNLIMVKQFRYPLQETFIEIPAGKLNFQEQQIDSLATAKRELAEETGYQAKYWEQIGIAHPCIGYSNEIIYYYSAFGLVKEDANPDFGEIVDPIEMKIEDVINFIKNGKITDSKTITGIFLAQQNGFI